MQQPVAPPRKNPQNPRFKLHHFANCNICICFAKIAQMAIKPNHLSQKRLKEIWAQVPPDYYDKGIAKNLLQRAWHTQKLSQILKILPKNLPAGRQVLKILDIGCSSAVLTAEVAKALPKSKVTGLDSYKGAIDFARQKYPHIDFVVADAHKLPFAANTFDLVICTETLEHVVYPKKALTEMLRVLKSNGRAIISMDSGSLLFRAIWYFWTKSKGRVWEGAHLHEFNAKLLENLIKKSGFKITKKNYSHLGMSVTFEATKKHLP